MVAWFRVLVGAMVRRKNFWTDYAAHVGTKTESLMTRRKASRMDILQILVD